jgi:hypothetical protein
MKTKDIVKAINMKKHNFSEDVIQEFNVTKGEQRIVEKMDELLTEKQRLLLHEYGGSCRGGETGRQAKILKNELSGKPLAEKIELMNKNGHMYKTELNADGTITAYCGCHCLQRRYKNPESSKAPSFYGCAAGAALYNIRTALGVKAQIKSIDYPQKDDGKKDMAFNIEIIE